VRSKLVVLAAVAVVGLAACGGADPRPSATATAPASGGIDANAANAANAADVEFATAMIPHHQQAVEMAELAELRAADARVKQLADRIKQAQEPEIRTMSEWLRGWGAPPPSPAAHGGHPGMMSDSELRVLMAASGPNFDRMFLDLMIRHHEGAIEMAGTVQRRGVNARARQLARQLATSQAAEIREMQELLTRL